MKTSSSKDLHGGILWCENCDAPSQRLPNHTRYGKIIFSLLPNPFAYLYSTGLVQNSIFSCLLVTEDRAFRSRPLLLSMRSVNLYADTQGPNIVIQVRRAVKIMFNDRPIFRAIDEKELHARFSYFCKTEQFRNSNLIFLHKINQYKQPSDAWKCMRKLMNNLNGQ